MTLRKLTTILLIFLHLLTTTDLVELLSFNKLFTHYKEHKKGNQNLSITEFLYMHYVGDDGTKADDNEDKQLPLHNPSIHSFTTVIVEFPKSSALEIRYEYSINSSIQNPRFNSNIQENYLPTLLHPPRLTS